MVILGSDIVEQVKQILQNTMDILSLLRALNVVPMVSSNQTVSSPNSNTRRPYRSVRRAYSGRMSTSSVSTQSTTPIRQSEVISPTDSMNSPPNTSAIVSSVQRLPLKPSQNQRVQHQPLKHLSVHSWSPAGTLVPSKPSTVQSMQETSERSPVLNDPSHHSSPQTQPLCQPTAMQAPVLVKPNNKS